MVRLDQRIAALEDRRRQEERSMNARVGGATLDPDELMRLYQHFMDPCGPATAEQVEWRRQLARLTTEEAARIYMDSLKGPGLSNRQTDKMVARVLADRPELPEGGRPTGGGES